MIHTDVIVVGGGPAGSSCARRLRQRGLDCLVLDRQEFPRAKPCAGWITPAVIADLEIQPGDYPHSFLTFRATTLFLGSIRLTVRGSQHAIRRVEFDQWLLARSGATVHRHTVRSIVRRNDGFVIDDSFACRYLVGAGGTECPVYRACFRRDAPRPREALVVAFEEEFTRENAGRDCLLWRWRGLPGYAWYVPKAGGFVNVGIGARADELRGRASLQHHWNRFVERLQRDGIVEHRTTRPVAHAYYMRHRTRSVQAGNAFLVGDAAGIATRDFAEGIGPAVRSGATAAEAIADGCEYRLDALPRFSQGNALGRILSVVFGLRERASPRP